MNFGYVFVLHCFQLVYKVYIFVHSVVVFDEIFFEVHQIFVRSLLSTINVDWAEVFVVRGLDEGEIIGISCRLFNGLHLTHS